MFDKKTERILMLMFAALIFAFWFNLMKMHFIRRDIAKEVFIEANSFSADSYISYMDGINFKKPVMLYLIKKGDVFIQWQIEGAPQGNFYGLKGSTPTQLGTSQFGLNLATCKKDVKLARVYEATKDFIVLSSYAGSVKDNWSTPQDETQTEGSKRQFFTTCKPCFERRK